MHKKNQANIQTEMIELSKIKISKSSNEMESLGKMSESQKKISSDSKCFKLNANEKINEFVSIPE